MGLWDAAAQAQGPKANREVVLAHMMAVHARHADRILELPDVVGVGGGVDEEDRPVLQVFSRKGRSAGLLAVVEGVGVQVVESGEFYAMGVPEL